MHTELTWHTDQQYDSLLWPTDMQLYPMMVLCNIAMCNNWHSRKRQYITIGRSHPVVYNPQKMYFESHLLIPAHLYIWPAGMLCFFVWSLSQGQKKTRRRTLGHFLDLTLRDLNVQRKFIRLEKYSSNNYILTHGKLHRVVTAFTLMFIIRTIHLQQFE